MWYRPGMEDVELGRCSNGNLVFHVEELNEFINKQNENDDDDTVLRKLIRFMNKPNHDFEDNRLQNWVE